MASVVLIFDMILSLLASNDGGHISKQDGSGFIPGTPASALEIFKQLVAGFDAIVHVPFGSPATDR
jgi:hypothetical protein